MAMFSTFLVWELQDRGVPLVARRPHRHGARVRHGRRSSRSLLIRPVDRKSPVAVFVVSIALFLGLNSLAVVDLGGVAPEAMPNLFPDEPDDFVRIFGAVWRYKSIGILVVALVLTALLFALFQKTKFGLAMRAVASNPDSARLVGIGVGTVLMASWGIAGAMGALSGTLVAGNNGEVNSWPDVLRVHLRLGGGDPRRLRQPGRRGHRRALDRRHREPRGRLPAGLDRPGTAAGAWR